MTAKQGITNDSPWTLTMVGLCMFTISVVTVRIPIADIGIIVGIIGLIFQREKFRFPSPAGLFAGLVVWAAFTSVFSVFPKLAYEFTYERLKLLLIFLVTINALRTEKQIRFFLWLYLASFVLSPGRGSLQGYAGGNTVWGRLMWNYNYNNPNDMAALTLLVTGFALALALSSVEKRLAKIIAWLCVLMFAIIIFLTQSRGVVLGTALAFGPALLVTMSKHRKVIIYAAAALAVIIYFVPQAAWDRFALMKNLTSSTTIAEADPEGSAENRLEIKKAAVQMFFERPIMGAGVGTYARTMAREFPELGSKDAHDTYLSLLTELGLPGLTLWLSMVIAVLVRARRARLLAGEKGHTLAQIWMERSTVGFLIAGFFGSFSGISYIYLYLGVLWCRSAILLPPASDAAPAKRFQQRPNAVAHGR